jgi:TAP-like protein
LEDAIASVRVPVLVLADPNDPMVPVDTALRLARALPDARLQLVEGAGHHLPRRIPDVVADAITAFVTGLEHSAVRDHADGTRWPWEQSGSELAVGPPGRPRCTCACKSGQLSLAGSRLSRPSAR